MKVTLDHNCIIDLLNGTPKGSLIRAEMATDTHSFFVVEIGASEMRKRGAREGNYDVFESLLAEAGVAHLPRLSPMGGWGVTFWGHWLWATEQMANLAKQIEDILFEAGQHPSGAPSDLDSPDGRKWVNRICDVLTMWCHIHYGNQVLLTSDKNFTKRSKLPRLLALGAGRICGPGQL